MAHVTFTTRASLVAGNPENIGDVTDCLDKLLVGVNAGDDAHVATDGVWRPFMSDVTLFNGLVSGSTYFVANGAVGLSGTTGTAIPRMLSPEIIADYAVAGRTTKLRVQATILVNGSPAGTTITFGLYPVTAATGSGSNVIYTLGTVVSGSTATPVIVAGGGDRQASTAFDLSALSALSTYVLGFTVAGTTTGVHAYAELQMRHI